jgi:hypothetical protein
MIFLSLYGKGQALQVTGGTVRYTGIPSLRLKDSYLRNLCTCSRRMALGYLSLRLKDSYLG